jgi:hypothetical protein
MGWLVIFTIPWSLAMGWLVIFTMLLLQGFQPDAPLGFSTQAHGDYLPSSVPSVSLEAQLHPHQPLPVRMHYPECVACVSRVPWLEQHHFCKPLPGSARLILGQHVGISGLM